MKETDFYLEVAEKLKREFTTDDLDVAYAIGGEKNLDAVVKDIQSQKKHKIDFAKIAYVPKIRIDILFSIRNNKTKETTPLLLEVKYAEQLKLMDYSQMVGYLHTSGFINNGILVLVPKPSKSNVLSNDLSELLALNAIHFHYQEQNADGSNLRNIRTGMMTYDPGGRFRNPLGEPNQRHLGNMEILKEFINKQNYLLI
ncbi:hypothetical protein AGMMS49938_16350 [Fibrobacterales bacterium]|nr:hypothetical protein AGMMS49938_16350 [Fibrobacterales bacterium]